MKVIFDAVDQEVIFDLPSRKGSVGVVDVVSWDDWVFVCHWTDWGLRKEDRGWSKECLVSVFSVCHWASWGACKEDHGWSKGWLSVLVWLDASE